MAKGNFLMPGARRLRSLCLLIKMWTHRIGSVDVSHALRQPNGAKFFSSVHIKGDGTEANVTFKHQTATLPNSLVACEKMPAFEVIAFLLGLSVASCVNFTIVYEWGESEMDLAWPTEEMRTQALRFGAYNPETIQPRYLAAYKERLFLSLDNWYNIPATLVSLPTSSANSAPPKLAPLPNWDHHEQSGCDTIYGAKGIEVDSNGHLWVVDADHRSRCKPKLWIFDLNDGDKKILLHHFDSSVSGYLGGIVIDQTPEKKQLAYITPRNNEYIIVFNRDEKKSWAVETPGHKFDSAALSHREQERQLYLRGVNSNEIHSVSVADLRSGNRTAHLKFSGRWEARPYRMLIDSANVLYAAFFGKSYISTWNTSEPFSERRFYQVGNLRSDMPFTFALDATGTFWMTENKFADSVKLLKAAVGAGSYLHYAPSAAVASSPSSTTAGSPLPKAK